MIEPDFTIACPCGNSIHVQGATRYEPSGPKDYQRFSIECGKCHRSYGCYAASEIKVTAGNSVRSSGSIL